MASSIIAGRACRMVASSASKRITMMNRPAITIMNYTYNNNNTTTISNYKSSFYFSTQSTEEGEKEEKPIIPGIGKGKTSTGLVGLAVEPDWYNIMDEKFNALLTKMERSDMPETAQYRIDVTKWCNWVLKQLKEKGPDDPEGVERECKSGQVEELIEMADDEMEVLDMYLESRMWELVEESNGSTIIDFDPHPTEEPDDEAVQNMMKEEMEEMKKTQEKK